MLRSASSQARCSCSSCSRRACALLLDIKQDAALGILAGALFLQQLFLARMRTTTRRRAECCARHPRRRAVLAAAVPGAHARC